MPALLPLIGKGLSWLGGGSAAAKGFGTVLSTAAPFLNSKGPSPHGQAYGQLAGAFKAADDHGLHRLAVAGSPAGYSPAPSNAAEGLLQAGQMIGQGRSKKEDQLLDAQIAEARSRTVLNEANARRALAGPQPGLGGPSSRLQDLLSVHLDRAGGDREVRVVPETDKPLTGTTNVGDVTMVSPEEEAFSVGLDELLVGALIYGPQWLHEQTQRLGRRSREGATETPGRDAARRSAQERNRRANQSDYLFPRR